MLESVPKEIPLHFVQETSITHERDLISELRNWDHENYRGPNVSFYEKAQEGCATDWNFCLQHVTSRYCLLLSSDITFQEDLLDSSLDIVANNPDIHLWSYKKKNMKAWVIDTTFFKEMGGFDQRFWIGGEDEDFLLRMYKKGFYLGQFRTHKLDHMDGGHNTRHITRPTNHVPSAEIYVKKWNWTTKDQMNAEVRPLEAKFTRSFWV